MSFSGSETTISGARLKLSIGEHAFIYSKD